MDQHHTPCPTGRIVALTELFLNRRSLLKGIAHSILRNEADAEDALQEAYYKAMNRIEQLADEHALLGWLCMIVRNHSLQMLRSRRVRQAGSIDTEPEMRFAVESLTTTEDESPEHICIEREMFQRTMARLDLLPANMKATVTMHYLSEMSLSEIAERQGHTIPALKSYLYRGRKILRGGPLPSPREETVCA
ncbi:sigma-70 family RNA polymerase sigma factor [Terriglobus albidus]|jgi:RNA polymerase sigma-70 factor (ECF subfamily)|uniref:Sigma-70 family RNA polymerase sigma factor n=1 Tax=Terriglobus albidus TaxID=1592106 RepID=A0A5B9EGM0_9BACT|nr:sigma-70 family RNA polymerase sigma factor [Terriglobus albidus]MBW8746178.1 sigma-70 family RNA polymerase sigma factor [Acidobacteriota bacterium]QEE29487.1 sigma-70 family RNA polymerase sigma factor [Terriglobus albidus]